MFEKFLPLSRPHLSKETIDEVVKVLESGWLATGYLTQRFESELSKYFGRKTFCFTSATSGLQASLIAIGVKPGDEVITTPLTFVATANTIAILGAKPVFVDVERDTFNIDPNQVLDAISDKTKAIMPVHYAGLSVDMDEIYKIAKEKGIRVIEDAAHAFGSCYKNRKIGSFGDIQVFSFHPIKNLTSGEGGAVVLDDPNEQKTIELQRFHGIDRSIWDRFSKTASCYYDVVFPGLKSNMSDIQAAIGIHQLSELEDMNNKRRRLMARYKAGFLDMKDDISFQNDPHFEHIHSGHLFAVLVDPKKRDDFMAFLKERSIGTTPYYTPLHLFSYYQKTFGYKGGDFVNAEYIGNRVVCLPLYPALTDAEQDYIIETIREFFGKSI